MNLRHCCLHCWRKILAADSPAPNHLLAELEPRPACGCGEAFPDYLVDLSQLTRAQRDALPFS